MRYLANPFVRFRMMAMNWASDKAVLCQKVTGLPKCSTLNPVTSAMRKLATVRVHSWLHATYLRLADQSQSELRILAKLLLPSLPAAYRETATDDDARDEAANMRK